MLGFTALRFRRFGTRISGMSDGKEHAQQRGIRDSQVSRGFGIVIVA